MKSHLVGSLFALLSLTLPAAAADVLIARWTFNDGLLKSDVGGFTLRQIDTGPEPTLTFAEGQARLDPRALLVCDQINSKDMPWLTKAITVWARIRIDTPVREDAFLFGLRDIEQPGNWRNMVLTMLARPEPVNGTGIYARMAAGTQVGTGSGMLPLEPGRFASVALVLDGDARMVTYVVDGRTWRTKHGDATSLADFANLAIGRLKAEGKVALMIDELRIYSVALAPEWVAEITPVK